MTERKKSWGALALLWGLLLLLAALRPLAVPDEGRYGDIGRWMLHSGDWLTPRLNGIPFFHKPPYLYWLEALSLTTFGVHAWALRLVPALHAGLMLLALYLATRQIASEPLARRCVVVLGTSLSFLIGGQYVNHDMLVAAWIGAAIWCFAFAFMAGERPDARLARLGFVACAFGVLSKGLIGLVLPGLVLLLWLLWTRQFKKVLYLPWLSGLSLLAAIALPWFVLAQRQFPGMLAYSFGHQQFNRYVATTFNNGQPWWFYLVCLLVLLFPWVLFVPNQALAPVRRSQSAPDLIAKPWLALCWIWLVAIIGFFSLPHSKLLGYALPVMPPLALLAVLGYSRWMGDKPADRTVFTALAVLALGVGVAANVVAGRYSKREGGTLDIARTLACEARPTDTVYALGGYPYDLPFYTQLPRPIVVLQDWPGLRQSAGDSWPRALFEGADFDAQAARVLQTPQVLATALQQPGQWVVAPNEVPVDGFTLVVQGRNWSLYRSAAGGSAAAPQGPEPAEHQGLPACQQLRP